MIQVSCNIYKQVPDGQSVMVRNEIKELGKEADLINDFFFKDELFALPLQKPNKRVFGLPLSQHIWAFYNKKKITKFTQYMKSKIGNSPNFFDSSKIAPSKVIFENFYFNQGYFDSKVTVTYKTKSKRTVVSYLIEPGDVYKIRNVFFDSSSEIQQLIARDRNKSFIQPKDEFKIANFSQEIDRITRIGSNNGYYTFNKEFIKFRFDTFKTTHELDVYVKILEETDTTNFMQYKLDSIRILVNHVDEAIGKISEKKQSNFGNIRFIQGVPKNYNEKFLTRFVYQHKDSLFSKEEIDYTIQRFSDLNNFKLINSSILLKSQANRKLDLYYSLTPYKKKTISIGQSVYNSTLGLLGTSTQLSYSNRNLTKKADRLSLSLSGSVDMNVYLNETNNNQPGFVSRLDLTGSASYTIEKFMVPFWFLNNNKSYLISHTNITSNYTYSKRLGFYDLHNIGASAGYEWTKKRANKFSYSPLSFNYIIIPEGSIQPDFEKSLDLNPFLRSSFTPAFILGSNFSFLRRGNYGKLQKNSFTFFNQLELAGNSAFIANKVLNLTDSARLTINNIDVSQFIKLQSEIINNNFLTKKSSLHSRLRFGIGLPYGNSSRLPYVRQFFLGGQYSLRAFQARTIGPGSYNPGFFDTDTSRVPRDQLGNLMIEANLEYRFNIISIFKGALFMDMGNIWNTSRDFHPSEDALFKFDQFYKQFYIGSGAGLRLDFNYFVMRLDLGIPIRVPYLSERDWVISDASISNSNWISNNVVLNFAVGFPF
jgi:outer membrane protein insertion porin family